MDDTQDRPNDIEAMESALRKANTEAQKHREQRNNYRGLATQLLAEKELSKAGMSNPRAAKYLDYSKISVTETGELEGLTEQLEALKEDLPEIFGETKKVSGGADAANKREASPQKSSAETLVERLRNG
ncbi:phage scaffolding protein [Streptomyces sp. NBC_00414]|uniref:phage scaffolding protein n=1 Tax=Streptomyces sp. NBC_00414 TaxID=2975739 RepID=UPI002E1CF5E9